MELARATVMYEGRVQGVGFRVTTRRLAMGFDVTGTVENMPDGRVAMVAEGDRGEVEEFLEEIVRSSLGGGIRRAEVTWEAARGDLKGFVIQG